MNPKRTGRGGEPPKVARLFCQTPVCTVSAAGGRSVLKLDELPDDARVVFFGKWADDDLLLVEAPDPGELCHQCAFAIGSRTTGASVKTDTDDWVHYHRDCYFEAVQESTAHDAVHDTLDADLEDFR